MRVAAVVITALFQVMVGVSAFAGVGAGVGAVWIALPGSPR